MYYCFVNGEKNQRGILFLVCIDIVLLSGQFLFHSNIEVCHCPDNGDGPAFFSVTVILFAGTVVKSLGKYFLMTNFDPLCIVHELYNDISIFICD